MPAFARDGTVRHDAIWWAHEGNRAIRAGDWKLVAAGKDGPWELYDLATDRTETRASPLQVPRRSESWRPAGNSTLGRRIRRDLGLRGLREGHSNGRAVVPSRQEES